MRIYFNNHLNFMPIRFEMTDPWAFYQRVSIASYANRWYSQRRYVRLSVRPSVRLSVTLRYCIKTKKASVMICPTIFRGAFCLGGIMSWIPERQTVAAAPRVCV